MAVIRKIADVKSGAVKIDLPSHFKAKKVKIIVRPIDESENGRESLQDLLLKAPTITDDELKRYEDVRNAMKKWLVREF